MDETELIEIVDAWIAGESTERGSPAYETNWWAISEVSDWSLEHNGDLLWRFILAAYKRVNSNVGRLRLARSSMMKNTIPIAVWLLCFSVMPSLVAQSSLRFEDYEVSVYTVYAIF